MGRLLTLLRKKGSAEFSPLDLPNLALWLDASDTTTITHDTGAVSEWRDKSTNARHVAQEATELRPSTGVNTLNGLGVVTFATSDYLANAAAVITGSTSRTVFVVTSHVGGDTFGAPFHLGLLNNTSANRGAFSCTREMAIRVQSGNELYDAALSTVGATLAVYGLDGALVSDLFARKDGVALGLTSSSSGTLTMNTEAGVSVGIGLSVAYRFSGRIAEVVAYGRALTAGEMATMEAYLADKWGITLP